MTSLSPLPVAEHGIQRLGGSEQLPSTESHESHEGGEAVIGAELFELGWAQLAVIREQILWGR